MARTNKNGGRIRYFQKMVRVIFASSIYYAIVQGQRGGGGYILGLILTASVNLYLKASQQPL